MRRRMDTAPWVCRTMRGGHLYPCRPEQVWPAVLQVRLMVWAGSWRWDLDFEVAQVVQSPYPLDSGNGGDQGGDPSPAKCLDAPSRASILV